MANQVNLFRHYAVSLVASLLQLHRAVMGAFNEFYALCLLILYVLQILLY